MLIDWFTIGAQVVNFAVLAWLLKRFLYRPILNAIDAREKRIAEELADADAQKAQAQNERDEFQNKNAEFDTQLASRMEQGQEEAKTERTRLLEAARVESEELRRKLQEALQNEQLSLQEALRQRAQVEVFAIARKALSDLAGTSLEARMTEILLTRLRELNDADKSALKAAFSTSKQALLVRTTFTMPEEQRAQIEVVIKEILGEAAQVRFTTAADLVSGIEISANGQKIAWSIAEYLASLANSVDELLRPLGKIQDQAEVTGLPAVIVKDGHESVA